MGTDLFFFGSVKNFVWRLREINLSAKMLAILIVLVSLGILAAAWLWNTRPTLVEIHAQIPDDFPDGGFSHDVFEDLLRIYVDGRGHVNYAAWHASHSDLGLLERYLAAVAAYSPGNAPDRFASDNDRLAYWMYAYNAFVIKAILDRWPLDSVTNVKAPVEIVKGLGFFYTLRFIAGGRPYSLYAIENDKVRKQSRDPRVHFVLNCGSESCPILRPELPDGDELEPFLAEAEERFIGEERNVLIDHEAKAVVLSAIFKWYGDDFVNDLKRRGLPSERGVLDYIIYAASGELRTSLERVRDYEIRFDDYDWSLNRAAASNP